MEMKELIKHFGTVSKAAIALEISVQAIYQWEKAGEIPRLRQSDIEVRTAYILKSDFTQKRIAKEGGHSEPE